MPTFEQQLANYAELAVQVGVNIQPNQYLYISASTEATNLSDLSRKKRMMPVHVKYLSIGSTMP